MTSELKFIRTLLSDLPVLFDQATGHPDFWARLQILLESLPLTTAEFSLLSNHLNNTLTYLEENQLGPRVTNGICCAKNWPRSSRKDSTAGQRPRAIGHWRPSWQP